MNKLSLIKLIGVISLIILISNTSAAEIGASSGYAPDRIEENSEVSFSGTVYNRLSFEIFVQSMVVQFRESVLGVDREGKTYNMTKEYVKEEQGLPSNTSRTDVFKTKVELSPGSYEVSIYFTNSNTVASATLNNNTYAMVNQTVLVTGVSSPLKTLRAIGLILGIPAMAYIIFFVYTTKIKK